MFIAEMPSLAEAVRAILPGTPERQGFATRVGNDWFVPLAGHILEQAMPDEYLPDDLPRSNAGTKRWRAEDLPIIPPDAGWILHPRASGKDDEARERDRKGNEAKLAKIAALLQQVDQVMHLVDPEAEGQLQIALDAIATGELSYEALHHYVGAVRQEDRDGPQHGADGDAGIRRHDMPQMQDRTSAPAQERQGSLLGLLELASRSEMRRALPRCERHAEGAVGSQESWVRFQEGDVMAKQPEDRATQDMFVSLDGLSRERGHTTAVGESRSRKSRTANALVRRFQARRRLFPTVTDEVACELCGERHDGECEGAA
ncbi:hypothetical protein [Ralstonia chuxiongensis]|nr:hypothetical protein [Ralstonia chuxiongensis]